MMQQAAARASLPLTLPKVTRPAKQVTVLRQWFKLSQEAFADVLGISRRTVARWELQNTGPDLKSAEGRWLAVLAEIKRLAEALWRDDPKRARSWLYSRLPIFHGKRPIDVLRSKGPLPVLAVLQAEEGEGYS